MSLSNSALEKLAHKILSGTIRSIAVLTGAGVSVSAGIPDFRSPGGMYDTLRPELLTATPEQRERMKRDPTSVVSWELFSVNQLPYLEIRRPFILGIGEKKWRPTLSHFFFQLLHEKGLLRRVYTQNIDGLDYLTNIPEDKISACHGTLATVSCEFCGSVMEYGKFVSLLKENIRDIYSNDKTVSTPILCSSCRKPGLKPNTVLYGRSLPSSFFRNIEEDFPANVDMLFIVGTSLSGKPCAAISSSVSIVGPANMIPEMLHPETPRILINRDEVAHFAERRNDFVLQSEADVALGGLARMLGWEDELFQLFKRNKAQNCSF